MLFTALTGFFLVFGAFLGSFCNVVILRMAEGLSVVFPPSRCPACAHRLSAVDLIPVFGWVFLGGRCRYCQVQISWQYPVVEAAVAGLLATAFARYGFSPLFIPSAALGIFWLITSVLTLRGEVSSHRPVVYAWFFLALFGFMLDDPHFFLRHFYGLSAGVFFAALFFAQQRWASGRRWLFLTGFFCSGTWPLLGALSVLPMLLAVVSALCDHRASAGETGKIGEISERSRHLLFLIQIAGLVLLSGYGFWPTLCDFYVHL